MDRRDFLHTLLAAPLLAPYIQASQKNLRKYEFYMITDHPERWLDFVFAEIKPHSSPVKFVFSNPHPSERKIRNHLVEKGWEQVDDPSRAVISLSGSRLNQTAAPSFTLVENGIVRDIRKSRLYSMWKSFQAQNPSRQMTVISFVPEHPYPGKWAVITRNGHKIDSFPLNQSVTKTYPADGGRITVKARQGKAWVADSSCRRKICRHAAPVFLAGERIICAPNSFMLEIKGREGVDTVIG